jgi:hypothetical protein
MNEDQSEDREAVTGASVTDADAPPQPGYLPARMVNEYVYCPRLFYYE